MFTILFYYMSRNGGKVCLYKKDYQTCLLLSRDPLRGHHHVLDAVDHDDGCEHHPQRPAQQARIGDGDRYCENSNTKGPFYKVNHRLQVGDGFVVCIEVILQHLFYLATCSRYCPTMITILLQKL